MVQIGLCGFPWIWWVILGSLDFSKFLMTFLVLSVTFGFSWVSVGNRVVKQFILTLTFLEVVRVGVVGRVPGWLDNSF